MSGLAIYTTEYEPRRLAAVGDQTRLDDDRVGEVVRFGDAPLDLLVESADDRLLWTFRAHRDTVSTRRDYLVADFTAEEDLFEEFGAVLRALHQQSGWALPYDSGPRWQAGFHLWRVEGDLGGLDDTVRSRLLAAVAGENGTDQPTATAATRAAAMADGESAHGAGGESVEGVGGGSAHGAGGESVEGVGGESGDGTVVFGMSSYQRVLEVLVAVTEAVPGCTVAVGSDGDPDVLTDVDLLLVPDAQTDFEPRSPSAAAIVGDRGPSASGRQSGSVATAGDAAMDLPGRLATALVVGLLAFSLFSFVSTDPVHPITGLATLGGFLGALIGVAHVGRGVGSVETTRPAWLPVSLAPFMENPSRSAITLAYGTAAAFVYPTTFRVAGTLVGPDQWLFGPVSHLSAALPSLVVFLSLVVGGPGLVLLALGRRRAEARLSRKLVGRVVVAVFLYGLLVGFATALANQFWFGVIPSTG